MDEGSEMHIPLETKHYQVEQETVDEFFVAFQSFKETNNKRLAELEARGSVDPLIEEKLQKIERFMQKQERKALDEMRPFLDGADSELAEAKSAMVAYVRKGRTEATRRSSTRA